MTDQNNAKANSLDFIDNLRKKMHENNLMLCYRGAFSQHITKSLLTMAERKLDMDKTEVTVKKKVFNVMVECLQNICKHEDANATKGTSLFMIGKDKSDYIMYSSNLVNNEKVEGLSTKLKTISTMDKDELKELYKSMLSSATFSEQAGAGLGLIDIARKSGNKLEYDFKKVNDKQSFFSLSTKISS